MRRVLVTGATGYIASQMLDDFRRRYELVLVDAKDRDRDGHTVPGVRTIDLAHLDPEGYRELFDGVRTVVHLAYKHGDRTDMRRGYADERDNVDLAFEIYQAAFETGVERVVVASSNHAADWYETLIRDRLLEMLTPHHRPLSDNWYGWAKEAYEHLGFVFASGSYGRKLPVVHVRIGAPRPIVRDSYGDDAAWYKRDLGAYISPRDLSQLFCRAIDAPSIDNEHGVPFLVVYGISNNTRAFWSIADARSVLGYAPEDDSEIVFQEDIAAWLMKPPGSPGKVGTR